MVRASQDARETYDALAPSYDMFTAGHDHEAWTRLVLDLAREAGLHGTRLLDLGCGTGNAIPPMLDRGFDVVGVDVSDAMLDIARRKLAPGVDLVHADVRALPVLGRFDLIWALSDVANYILDEEELVATFTGIGRNLRPDGVVAFDVDSLATMRALYSSLLVRQGEGEVVVFQGRAEGELRAGGVGEADLDRLVAGDEPPFWERCRSVHRQRHHAPEVIRRALESAGLRCHSITGVDRQGERFAAFDDLEHNKAVYIARHGAQDE